MHKVRRGQTLGQIARRYRTRVSALMRLNGLKRANFIRAGQKLRVLVNDARNPSRVARVAHARVSSQQTGELAHTVRRGETLGVIAHRYRTTVASLKQLNNITHVKRLQIGQRLRVLVNDTRTSPRVVALASAQPSGPSSASSAE